MLGDQVLNVFIVLILRRLLKET